MRKIVIAKKIIFSLYYNSFSKKLHKISNFEHSIKRNICHFRQIALFITYFKHSNTIKNMKRIAIFASGSGSNAENIIKHFENNKEVCFPFILVNKQDAYVHERAKKLGLPSQTFSKQELEDGTILKLLKDNNIDFIILAGFLLKIPEAMVDAYPRRIVNIHPALLPKYGGKGMYGHHVHEAVVAAKETESGITIHYVDSHYDHGNTICQAHCAVAPTDTPDDVAANVHKLEYIYFPLAIEQAIADL